MKLSGAEAARFCAAPKPGVAGALIFGADAGQVAERRDQLLAKLLGPDAEAEMRLARLTGADLRADPAALDAALRAQGFFPGPRAVLVTQATDGLAPLIGAALAGAAAPEAFLLVTADALTGKSALRALFEGAKAAVAAPCYAEAPDARALAAMLAAAGARDPAPEALELLQALSQGMDRGALARLVEVLALYAREAEGALSAADVAACAPPFGEAAADAAIDAALDGETAVLRAQLARLAAQGGGGVALAIAAARHVRALHAVAAAGAQAGGALMRIQPPSRRDRAAAQARRWGAARLERALETLYETDAALRGGSNAPPAALLERALLRLANAAPR